MKDKKDCKEWENKYLRALADYHNLEKRVAGQLEAFKKGANKELLLKFLDILDSLDRAEIFIKDNGLRLVKADFENLLKNAGVVEVEILRKTYDPNIAECVEVVEGKNDNKVVEVVRKGYKLQNDILRVARVKVEKKVIN